MRKFVAVIAALFANVGAAEAACREEARADARYVVCEFNPSSDEIRLFLADAAGAPYGDFDSLVAALGAKGELLRFAMNAGMYLKDRSPVGLYVEDYDEKKKLSTKDGPGNFHLKPNGVFWIDAAGAAHVTETSAYLTALSVPVHERGGRAAARGGNAELPQSASLTVPPHAGEQRNVAHATQSGPMLVIDGALHPRFLADATSKKRRNGVGVRDDGSVVFAISDAPVTFHEFATYFRDELDCPNALYLDGTISRLYAPELNRNDQGLPMGPVVGVVAKAGE